MMDFLPSSMWLVKLFEMQSAAAAAAALCHFKSFYFYSLFILFTMLAANWEDERKRRKLMLERDIWLALFKISHTCFKSRPSFVFVKDSN